MKQIDLTPAAPVPKTGHTSKGDQPKWERGGRWYKADHMGYEALSEVVISALLRWSNVPDFVSYQPIWIYYQERKLRGCVSKNFRSKQEMLVPLERLHRAYEGGRGLAATLAGFPDAAERIRYTVDFIERTTGLAEAGAYLTMLLELDAFFLNEDRHTNNLAVLRDEISGQFRFCPVFDNGLALLSDLNDYPMSADLYACIGRVQAKPFDMDFLCQVEAAESLYSPQLQFTFTRQDVSQSLENLTQLYPAEIMQRVERVLYEQMRRFQAYF